MPRKQRFKPSRKPKAIGTATDLAPLAEAGTTVATGDPARSREVTPAVIDADVHTRETGAFSSAAELGGESG